MGQNETRSEDDNRTRLLEAARVMVLRGDGKFSISSLCAEAGVERNIFRDHFAGKTALMAALMQSPSGGALLAQMAGGEEVDSPEPVLQEPVSKAVPESSVSTPDAWLERRLRVFERALNALETRADTAARDQARAIAQLEEKLNGQAFVAPTPLIVPLMETAPQNPLPVSQAPAAPKNVAAFPQVHRVELAQSSQAQVPPAAEMRKSSPDLMALAPAPVASISKEEMADVLQTVRDKVRAAAAEPELAPPSRSGSRTRWLAIAALSLVVLFLFVGLSLGKNGLAGSANAQESDGITHRRAASSQLGRTIALADAGNPRAQARLALAYLRGQGSAGHANAALLWTLSAARAGNPVAQYLLGVLYQQGDQVKANPVLAVAWFMHAAQKGNIKAMHNLAIAYAQGQGVEKDEARAAEWFTRAAERGYVDSAFDLAVLYERGTGVTQDLKQAMKWYAIAGQAGDQPSRERVEVLRGQMKPQDIKLATNAAQSWSALPALDSANNL